jgi:hypothetical protein
VSTAAINIRNAVFERLAGWPGYRGFGRSPLGTGQPNQLPGLAVYLSGESERPDGDPNAGEPKFISDVAVAVALTRMAGDKEVLEGLLDDDASAMKQWVLCDPSFTGFGDNHESPPGETWEVGALIYWDAGNRRATSDPTRGALMGVAVRNIRSNIWRVDGLFEGITQILRRPVFFNQGDAYYAELRLELTFQVRTNYPPVILDDYRKTVLRTQQLNSDPDSPVLTTVIDQAS